MLREGETYSFPYTFVSWTADIVWFDEDRMAIKQTRQQPVIRNISKDLPVGQDNNRSVEKGKHQRWVRRFGDKSPEGRDTGTPYKKET